MAVVVEDGTKVTGANSYVSDAELVSYATARGYTLVTSSTALLIRATDFLETLFYIGQKSSKEQLLQWPRVPSVTSWGNASGDWLEVDGWIIQSDEIPERLKKGQLEVAYQMDQGFDKTTSMTQAVKLEKVGPLTIEYAEGSDSAFYLAVAQPILNPLLASGGSVSRTVRI